MQPSYPPRGPGGFVHPVATGKPHSYVKPNQVSAGVFKRNDESIRKVERGALLCHFSSNPKGDWLTWNWSVVIL